MQSPPPRQAVPIPTPGPVTQPNPQTRSPLVWIVFALVGLALVSGLVVIGALVILAANAPQSQTPPKEPSGSINRIGIESTAPADRLMLPAEVSVTASSEKPSSTIPCRADSAYDGLRETSWCEGADGPGDGESLTFTFTNGRHKVTRILIVAGYDKYSDDQYGDRWTLNNRPKTVKVLMGGAIYECSVDPNDRSFQTLKLPESDQVEQVTLTFVGVIQGTAKSDSDMCISEVQIYVSE